LEEKLQDDIT